MQIAHYVAGVDVEGPSGARRRRGDELFDLAHPLVELGATEADDFVGDQAAPVRRTSRSLELVGVAPSIDGVGPRHAQRLTRFELGRPGQVLFRQRFQFLVASLCQQLEAGVPVSLAQSQVSTRFGARLGVVGRLFEHGCCRLVGLERPGEVANQVLTLRRVRGSDRRRPSSPGQRLLTPSVAILSARSRSSTAMASLTSWSHFSATRRYAVKLGAFADARFSAASLNADRIDGVFLVKRPDRTLGDLRVAKRIRQLEGLPQGDEPQAEIVLGPVAETEDEGRVIGHFLGGRLEARRLDQAMELLQAGGLGGRIGHGQPAWFAEVLLLRDGDVFFRIDLGGLAGLDDHRFLVAGDLGKVAGERHAQRSHPGFLRGPRFGAHRSPSSHQVPSFTESRILCSGAAMWP